MISMLSQLSSTQSEITPFQYERPHARKGGMLTTLVATSLGIAFALFAVNGLHGIVQAFRIV